MKRVLVTGGAGFIGRRVVDLLAARHCHVAALDNLYVKRALPRQSAWIEPYEADIRDPAAMDTACHRFKPDAIIHLAALHHIPTCEQQPRLAMEINILGTQTILDAAANHGIKKIVLASSAAVYDWWDHALIEDKTPLRASDVYSTCKIANEHQAQIWAAKTGGGVSLARIFNVIGHDDPNGHIIPDILKQISPPPGEHRAVVKLGNTAPRRDYTHADDTASGLLALLDHLPASGMAEAYNLSFGQEYAVTDLVAAIGNYLGLDITIEQDPARIRKIDRLHLLGEPEKTARITGWRAQIPFDQALTRILDHLVPALAARAG